MKISYIVLTILFSLTVICCSGSEKDKKSTKTYRTFVGMSYRKAFNDLQDLHLDAAKAKGVGPLDHRGDTSLFKKQLVRIPDELELFKLDRLKHSIPFLVPEASALLGDIGLNFRDSLKSKKMPLYKLVVTSVTRTNEDVQNLRRRNYNASEESTHCYGTTFDIAWVRYNKVDETDERTADDGQLKAVLGQVLFDLKERERCYIKHEQKQSCFHITVR